MPQYLSFWAQKNLLIITDTGRVAKGKCLSFSPLLINLTPPPAEGHNAFMDSSAEKAPLSPEETLSVGIYGLGRFGSFWASSLARHPRLTVKGCSRRPKEPPPGVELVSRQELLQQDVLILCVSISAMKEVLRTLGPELSPRTVVMDTCSVKVYPSRLMEQYLPRENPLIATHPMFGPDSARQGLKDLPLVFSPLRGPLEIHRRWENIFRELQLQVIPMTPDQHDREAAFTQGITHFIGRTLADLHLEPSEIGTAGYRQLFTIMQHTCNDPWQLFLDLQQYNPYTPDMRHRLHRSLQKILGSLGDSIDSDSLGT